MKFDSFAVAAAAAASATSGTGSEGEDAALLLLTVSLPRCSTGLVASIIHPADFSDSFRAEMSRNGLDRNWGPSRDTLQLG